MKEYYVPVVLMRPISNRQFDSRGKYMISTTAGNVIVGNAMNGVVALCGSKTMSDCGEQYLSDFSPTLYEQNVVKGSSRNAISTPTTCDLSQLGGIERETKIMYAIDHVDGTCINHKGGTVRRLYERFHNICQDNAGRRLNRSEITFSIPCVTNENYVVHQKILNIVKLPIGTCYKIITVSGRELIVTEEQQLCTSNSSSCSIDQLSAGDYILIHNNTCFTKEYAPRKKYAEICVKYHPYGVFKIVDKKYSYYRIQVSHAVYEAHMNGLSYENYVSLLNSGDQDAIQMLRFIDRTKFDIHHKDLNSENNSLDNLELLTKSDHGKVHAMERKRNLSFVAVKEKIKSIEKVEKLETYAVICEKYQNFVANGFVIQSQVG
jgi:hypothetical protein